MKAVDAEATVIGALVINNELLHEVSEIVSEHDFFSAFYRRAFATCMRLKGGFDAVILARELGGENHLEMLQNAIAQAPASAAVLEHAKRIANTAVMRRFVDACTEATAEAVDFDSADETAIAEMVTRHQAAIMASTERVTASKTLSSAQACDGAMRLIVERYDRRQASAAALPGFATGLGHIDQMIGGMQRKHLVIVGAQTGVGKSAFAINAAIGVTQNSAKTLFCSYEMNNDDVMMRALSAESGVYAIRMQYGDLGRENWPPLMRAKEKISAAPMWITDSPPRNIPKMFAQCLQQKRRHGLDVVVIDYLQLMEGSRGNNNREQVVAEIARGLKQLAMDLDVCVIALSQLNYTTSRHEEPQLQSLRESAAIGQNANSVLLLWTTSDDTEQVNFKVAKNRSGPNGKGILNFNRALQRFRVQS